MIKKEVDKNDRYRTLLTDTLPYEVPFPFSNFYLHALLRRQAKDLPPDLRTDLIEGRMKFCVPYTYQIYKTESSFRTLSIAHPGIQREVCDFYKKYEDLIVEYCSRSAYSLRRPANVATHFFEANLVDPDPDPDPDGDSAEKELVEVEPAPFAPQADTASSYFVYRDYNPLYKFIDSDEFIELEKRYRYLTTFDVSRCFYNIYTHSISWAVKSKGFAKKTIGCENFEETFDKLIRKSNYNETHGIPVGPEVSRVFAEIIFQRIDVDVEADLRRKGLEFERDYVVRRYVDDYHVFSNSERTARVVQDCVEEKLEEFKLYLNSAKTTTVLRPFISAISIAKIAAAEAAQVFVASVYTSDAGEMASYRKIGRSKLTLINSLRAISSQTGAPIGSFAKFTLSIVTKQMRRQYLRARSLLREVEGPPKFKFFNRQVLEVLFYLYEMDCSVRTTYLVSSFLLFVLEIIESGSSGSASDSKRDVFELSTKHIKAAARKTEYATVETLNLLVVLRGLGHDFMLPQRMLMECFHLQLKDGVVVVAGQVFGYFQIVVLLYYRTISSMKSSA